METVWRIEMLGTLRVVGTDSAVVRFRTKRVALLLAYLACYRNRAHFRDEVAELLWPEADPVAVRRNLRQALTSLRHVLEPPPLPPGSILQVQQARLRLNPELVTTDIYEFERAIADARRIPSLGEQIPFLLRAVDIYVGEFLPGYGEDWVAQERLRLDDLYVFCLRRLIDHSRQSGNTDEAIRFLRLALAKERLSEDLHIALMEQYLAAGRSASALQQFDDLRQQLWDQLGEEPSDEAFRLRETASKAADLFGRPTSPSRKTLPVDPEIPNPSRPEDEETSPVVRLPVHLTRFCGRQGEISYAMEHLLRRNAHLTTLFGPAGTGKTRLAAEVGRRLAESGEWNVWFVAFADVSSASVLMDAILETVKARGPASQDPFDRLRSAIHGPHNNLLILDNLEHIVEEVAPIIDQLIHRVTEIRVLTTSRQLLRLGTEHQIPVPPLPIPSAVFPAGDELSTLTECPSVQLFVDRCQAIRPDFQLTANNAKAISTICAKLEGIPLAIELAAGLSGSFPPSQMVFHLQKRLSALTSRRRDMPARHRSLRAAIDYSYETLPLDLQGLYAALSVFRGGFKIEAAYEVCYRDEFERPSEDASVRRHPHDDCLDRILEFQERSLLRSESADEECELSFHMLESFREYAEERLSEADQRRFRARHAEFYRQRPPKPSYAMSTEERTKRHLWIESEYENYLAAIDHYFDDGCYEDCIELLNTLATTWSSRGPRGAERSTIRRLADRLAHQSIDPRKHILLLRMLGTTYIRSMEYAAAHRVCEAALAIAVQHELSDQIAVCYTAIATCAGYLGNLDECMELSRRVLEIVPEDNLLQRERANVGIGAVHWGRGEMSEADRAFREAADISARLRGGDPDTLILYNLARVSLDMGRLDDAMSILGNANRICQRTHDDFGLATSLSLVSRYYWLKRNFAAAIATGHEALSKYRAADFSHFSFVGIFQQALILADLGELEAATTLLAASQGIGRAARLPDEWDHNAAIETIRKQLPVSAFERAWARGLAMDTDEAIRLALRYK